MEKNKEADCKALQEILRCCKKPIKASYEKETDSYFIKCDKCKKEYKSPSLAKIIFDWNK